MDIEYLILNYDKKIIFNRKFFENQYNNGLLKNAKIFGMLFKLEKETEFKDGDMEKDENGYITLCKFLDIRIQDWNIFLNFLKCGILNDKTKYNLDILSGISNKFGGIPFIDKYYKDEVYNMNKINEELENIYNPLTPEEDIRLKYDWVIDYYSGSNTINYSATISLPDMNGKFYFRKKRV